MPACWRITPMKRRVKDDRPATLVYKNSVLSISNFSVEAEIIQLRFDLFHGVAQPLHRGLHFGEPRAGIPGHNRWPQYKEPDYSQGIFPRNVDDQAVHTFYDLPLAKCVSASAAASKIAIP